MDTLEKLGPIFPIFIPMYAFKTQDEALVYIAYLKEYLTEKQQKNIIVMDTQEGKIVSCPGWREACDQYQNGLFFSNMQRNDRYYKKSIMLSRNKAIPPQNAKPVCLFLEGIHYYTKTVPVIPENLMRLQKIFKDPKKIATACGNKDTKNIIEKQSANASLGFTLYTGTSGRVVIYSQELLLSVEQKNFGCVIGSTTSVVFLTFSMIRSKRGDRLKVQYKWITENSNNPTSPKKPEICMDKPWVELYENARKRFLKECTLHDEETVRLIYRAHVRTISFDDALKTVTHSWQLDAVLQEHLLEGYGMVFSEDAENLFKQLLECHPCSEERRRELRDMAETHIFAKSRNFFSEMEEII